MRARDVGTTEVGRQSLGQDTGTQILSGSYSVVVYLMSNILYSLIL